MSAVVATSDLPGGDRIEKGLGDLAGGRVTVEALLIVIAAPALARLGLEIPVMPELGDDAELLLYEKLQEDGVADPYSAYNASLRLIVSFTRALSQRRRD
jgi:hypothetical protein